MSMHNLISYFPCSVSFLLPVELRNWLIEAVNDHYQIAILLSLTLGLISSFTIVALVYRRFPRLAAGGGFFYPSSSSSASSSSPTACGSSTPVTQPAGQLPALGPDVVTTAHRSSRAARRAKRKATAAAAGAPLPRLPSGHPGLADPVAALASHETEDVPFQCPFMEAFKTARLRDEQIFLEAKEAIARGERPPCPKIPERVSPGEDRAPSGPPSTLELRMARALVQDAGNHLGARTQFDEDTSEEEHASDDSEQEDKEVNRRSAAAGVDCGMQEAITSNLSSEDVQNFYEHIPAFVKTKTQEKLLSGLSSAERQDEFDARSRQMAEILAMMKQSESVTCGVASLEELEQQMQLYVK